MTASRRSAVPGFAVLLDNNIQSSTNEIGPHAAVEEFAELAGAVLIALGMRVRYFEAIGVPWSRFVAFLRHGPRGAGPGF